MIAIPGLVVYYTMSSRRPSKAKHSGESQRRINSSATLEERKCLSVLAMEEHWKGNSVTANTLDVEDHKHRSAPLQRRAGSASASCLSRTISHPLVQSASLDSSRGSVSQEQAERLFRDAFNGRGLDEMLQEELRRGTGCHWFARYALLALCPAESQELGRVGLKPGVHAAAVREGTLASGKRLGPS